MAHTLISMPVWNCLFLMSHTPWIGVAIALFWKMSFWKCWSTFFALHVYIKNKGKNTSRVPLNVPCRHKVLKVLARRGRSLLSFHPSPWLQIHEHKGQCWSWHFASGIETKFVMCWVYYASFNALIGLLKAEGTWTQMTYQFTNFVLPVWCRSGCGTDHCGGLIVGQLFDAALSCHYVTHLKRPRL